MIKILDTFAGVWGFSLALENAIGKEKVEHIGFCEIDKFAKQVYSTHFPNAKDLGDISKLDIGALPDFDILTGGFPCQDVSVAGKQSLDGGRTILVEYLLRILEEKQPRYFIFENVKGLMSKKFDTFRQSIFDRIEKAWYNFRYDILNTKDYWLPQNRERVFIVWVLGYWNNYYTVPEKQKLTTFLKDILEEKVDNKFYLTEKQIDKIKYSTFTQEKTRIQGDICQTLLSRDYKDPKCVNIEFNNKRLTETFKKVDTNDVVFLDSYNSKVCKDIAPTITTRVSASNTSHLSINRQVRKLTPTECERLQGFPDNWTSQVSNSQRYKQMGNAISVPVVEAILKNLIK